MVLSLNSRLESNKEEEEHLDFGALGGFQQRDPSGYVLVLVAGVVRYPGGNPGANRKSISHRCHPILVGELTEETIDLPLGCLQGGPLCGGRGGRGAPCIKRLWGEERRFVVAAQHRAGGGRAKRGNLLPW